MRKLVILRGSMGAGKSTWLRENNLEKYTLCADTIRLNLAAPAIGIDGHDIISQEQNAMTWDILFIMLEERMKRGEFTIIDAVHSKSNEFSRYKHLAEKYRYRLYCVDFTDVPIERAKFQNKQRPLYKQVPETQIDKVYARFKVQGKTSGFTIIKPDDFFKVFDNNTNLVDYNKYKAVHIFGDIHGCYEPIKDFFDKHPYNEDEMYIFLGDLFDRGLQNVEVFNFIMGIINNPNVFVLTGNHELHIGNYIFGDTIKSRHFADKTLPEFERAGIHKEDLKRFYQKLGQIAWFTYAGKKYIASHGGIPYIPSEPLDFYSTMGFIKGIGNYQDDIDNIFSNWALQNANTIYQVHGHRNIYKNTSSQATNSFNLEGGVEFGSDLRVLNLLPDGTQMVETFHNSYYNQDLGEKVSKKESPALEIINNNVDAVVEEMKNNRYVQIKRMAENGVYSFNFTREAFNKEKWDNTTIKARGLFIDVPNSKIQARSYNKFFNKEQVYETKIASLINNLKFPVFYYKKYNGFLGLLSLRNGEFYFCTKSSDSGDYVDYFKNIFYDYYTEKQRVALKERLEQDDCTIVFEVIDPIRDPHIIKYDSPKLVLLDIVYNTIEFKCADYSDILKYNADFGIETKELLYVAKDISDFLYINNLITDENYKWNGEYIEGFVVVDSSGFMFKYKTEYYNKWKNLRRVSQGYMKSPTNINKFLGSLLTAEDNEFLGFLKKEYPVGGSDKDIIKLRDEFIKYSQNT